jgi:hypothetical protein
MKSLLRLLISLLMLLAMLVLVGCSGGAPGCPQVDFGSSTCSASSGGTGFGGGGSGGGGGGGGSGLTAFAYAVDQGTSGTGTIDGYQLSTGSSGTFGAISGYAAPSIPLNSGGVGMLVAQKQYLYVGLGDTEQLYGYTIASSGSLTPISGSPYSVPALGLFLNGVGQANMIANPAGTLLFISDAGQSLIYEFQIGSGGVLTAATGSPFSLPSGFLPMNLATDGLGKYLYVVDGTDLNHQGSAIAAFLIGTGGALTPVTGSPFTGNVSGADFAMWQLAGEPTGQFLIGTSGSSAFYAGVVDDPNLYVFSIEQSGANAGALTQTSVTPTVYSPFSIAVQSNTNQNLLYSFSFNDTATEINPIEGYSISSAGTLTVVTGSPFSNAVGDGTWGQFDQSGDILMAYASYYNTSTSTQVTQLAPLSVPTNGDLTQAASTLTLVTPGFWVVTDQP